VPVSKPRPIGLYARIPMPSSRNVGTKSFCKGTINAHTSEADCLYMRLAQRMQWMLASLLPMRYARIWQVRNGEWAQANEKGNRELPMRNQEKQPRRKHLEE